MLNHFSPVGHDEKSVPVTYAAHKNRPIPPNKCGKKPRFSSHMKPANEALASSCRDGAGAADKGILAVVSTTALPAAMVRSSFFARRDFVGHFYQLAQFFIKHVCPGMTHKDSLLNFSLNQRMTQSGL